jgi:DNA helicase HerA-like ATPase
MARSSGFVVDSKTLLRHTLIVGATGSGKTNHSLHLIKTVMENEAPSCLIVDVKGEYRALEKLLQTDITVLSIGGEPKAKFNPLVPPSGVDADHWDRAFADVFTLAYGLSEPSRRILLDSLSDLRDKLAESPTLRELESEVHEFDAGSPREQNSRQSLESRLHIINTGPIGESLNTEAALALDKLDVGVTVFEIGNAGSLRDQMFLAELFLLYLWQHDKYAPVEEGERIRRLVVVEEAHRYLSEERPPEKRGDRTLLELAIAEARRYGWGFLIIDQMPTLLSKYVWDNVGTVLVHRLTNIESFEKVRKSLVMDPMTNAPIDEMRLAPILMSLPEDLAFYRKYVGSPLAEELFVGIVKVPKLVGGGMVPPQSVSTEK